MTEGGKENIGWTSRLKKINMLQEKAEFHSDGQQLFPPLITLGRQKKAENRKPRRKNGGQAERKKQSRPTGYLVECAPPRLGGQKRYRVLGEKTNASHGQRKCRGNPVGNAKRIRNSKKRRRRGREVRDRVEPFEPDRRARSVAMV